MKNWLLSASLIAVVTFAAYGEDARPARPRSYPITLKADEVREFTQLQIEYAGLQLSSPVASEIPIMIEPGVTGMMLIGNGTFRFKPRDGAPLEGNFRAAMPRFNPKN